MVLRFLRLHKTLRRALINIMTDSDTNINNFVCIWVINDLISIGFQIAYNLSIDKINVIMLEYESIV